MDTPIEKFYIKNVYKISREFCLLTYSASFFIQLRPLCPKIAPEIMLLQFLIYEIHIYYHGPLCGKKKKKTHFGSLFPDMSIFFFNKTKTVK